MGKLFDDLLSIAGDPLAEPFGEASELTVWGSIGDELARMLTLKNGFYAYESALLVRPFQSSKAPLGIEEWNSPSRWLDQYHEDLGKALFFAEDVFGGQYCIRANAVCTFDPETGTFETMAASLDEWAADIVRDYEFLTGYPLAHEWQSANRALAAGERLLPKVPFVCGGKYELGNLYAASDEVGMRFRATIANQIRDLPDGAQITFTRPE